MTIRHTLAIFWLLLTGVSHALPNILIEGWDGVQWKNISDNDLNPNQQVTDFDDVDYGTFKDRDYRIRNTGNQSLQVSVNGNSPSSTSSQFTFPGFPSSLFLVAANSSRNFKIRYTPVTASRTTTIRIDSNSGNSGSAERIYTFAVKGAARAGIISVNYNPSSGSDVGIAENGSATVTRGTDFGSLRVGGGGISNQTRTRSFYVRNSSSATDSLAFHGTPTLTGPGASHFQIISLGTSRLNPGNNRNFQIRFDPSSAGTKTAVLTIRSNDVDDNPFRVNLRGVGVANPEIRVQGRRQQTGTTFTEINDNDTAAQSADGTRFDNTDVGSSRDSIFRIHNDGDAPLQLSNYDITGAGENAFSFIGTDTLIAAGSSLDFEVRFTPPAAGTYNATVTFATNDSNENPFNFVIRGSGLAPEIAVAGRDPDNIFRDISDGGGNSPSVNNGTHYGNQDISGGAAQRTFRITNSGNDRLTISGRRFIGDNDNEFSVSNLLNPTVRNIDAGRTHDFTISYDPKNLGTDNVIFEMTTNDPNEGTFTFDLRGVGIGFPEIRVQGRRERTGATFTQINDNDNSARSEDGTRFDNTDVGSSRDSIFRVHNDGDGTLTLSNHRIEGDDQAFTFLGLDASVPAGESRDFEVRFTPPSTGTFNATVRFTTNDSNENPFNFVIRGSGLAPEIAVSGRNAGNVFNNIIDGGGNSPSANNGTDYGDQDIAGGKAQRVFRISNTGNDVLKITSRKFIGDDDNEFSVSNLLNPTQRNIDPGKTHDFTISYDPKNLGTDIVTFSMATNDPNEDPFTFQLRGTGVGFPDIQVRGLTNLSVPFDIDDGDTNPTNQDVTQFGNVTLGKPQTRNFRIVNGGLGTLQLTQAISSNPRFEISGVASIIGAGESDDFTVKYTPNGIRDDDRTTITLRSNVDGSKDPYTFSLTANAVGPVMEIFGGTGFSQLIRDGDSTPREADGTLFPGRDPISGSVKTSFQIKNSGNRAISIEFGSKVTGEGSDSFTLSNLYRGNPFVNIGAGSTHTFDVTFDPTESGLIDAQVYLVTNASDSTQAYTFNIRGLGLEPGANPDIEVTGLANRIITSGDNSPRLADGTSFGTVDETDRPVSNTFTIHNRSVQSTLNVSGVSVAVSGGRPERYSVSQASDNDIEPGGSATFTVTLDPSVDLGNLAGTVTISSDDPDTPSYTFNVGSSINEVVSDDPPSVSKVSRIGNDLVFDVEGSGTFKITTSTTLEGPWFTVAGKTGLSAGSIRLSDVLNQGTTAPRRFYRVEKE